MEVTFSYTPTGRLVVRNVSGMTTGIDAELKGIKMCFLSYLLLPHHHQTSNSLIQQPSKAQVQK